MSDTILSQLPVFYCSIMESEAQVNIDLDLHCFSVWPQISNASVQILKLTVMYSKVCLRLKLFHLDTEYFLSEKSQQKFILKYK